MYGGGLKKFLVPTIILTFDVIIVTANPCLKRYIRPPGANKVHNKFFKFFSATIKLKIVCISQALKNFTTEGGFFLGRKATKP